MQCCHTARLPIGENSVSWHGRLLRLASDTAGISVYTDWLYAMRAQVIAGLPNCFVGSLQKLPAGHEPS
ncbi:hypothetical protein PAMC26577_38910 [Caballeronia sordidicola]|uniref:Uncharacterized protein n=1 Tax=Caballeronia sordidicola TaxID=196367 RepID=A0A242M3D5_CABSO|nr:hypothetical protein PAMC26577_38910 [Caballeronia sordidicola]